MADEQNDNRVQAELVKNLIERERRLSGLLESVEKALDSCSEDDIEAMTTWELDAEGIAKRLTDIDEVLRLLEAR